MAKIRVYELARKYNISSEALIKILVKEGFAVKSHMSTVEQRAELLIEQHLNRVKAATKKEVKKKDKKEKPPTPKPQRAPRPRKEKKVEKRKEADQKAVKESVKRTLAKLDITRKTHRRKHREDVVAVVEEENVIHLPEFSTVAEIAEQLKVDPSAIIQKCLGLGLMVTINQRLNPDAIIMIADDYGFKVEFTESYGHEILREKRKGKPERMQGRPPVVTIMGHVDHGKTSLLDAIRKSHLIAGEKGGITQHIGAYEVETGRGRITFIDTPGHEAFTAMRARGAQVTDIVVLVVAADDGIMPQTIEAINHARAADVPMIIAINKIDLPNASIERVKRELLKQNIVLEEYGGNVMGVEMSAKLGSNVDKLLEMILFQAEMMDLKADAEAPVRGVVLEARKEEGRGNVCTVLIQQGTLRIGDVFIAGNYYGHVRALLNERNNKIDSAPPSSPVVVLGCMGLPNAGENFVQVEDDRTAREISLKRLQYQREKDRRVVQRITLDDLYKQIKEGKVKELNLIIKADMDGSVGALVDSLSSINSDEVKIEIIHKGVGVINEGDVLLASASNAVVIGFHVNMTPKAAQLAKYEKVDVRHYDIIYQAIDDIKAAMSGLLEPVITERDTGVAEVRQVFKVSKVGAIAGCHVKSGSIARSAKVRVRRGDEILHTGPISSLKRFKDDAKEVQAGFDCGIGVSGFDDFMEGDLLEAFVEEAKSKSIE
ncbi:MAG: translation initiation factor IF-2 [Candidatus Krumholzibacteria bacterium]|nr:translation initiation factor IF-2 [Candidatus Krumholzibacteria bacterium]